MGNKVYYSVLEKAIADLQEKFPQKEGFPSVRFYMDGGRKRPISLTIQISGSNQMSAEAASEFSDELTRAAQAAKDFPYNGYFYTHINDPEQE